MSAFRDISEDGKVGGRVRGSDLRELLVVFAVGVVKLVRAPRVNQRARWFVFGLEIVSESFDLSFGANELSGNELSGFDSFFWLALLLPSCCFTLVASIT